jgi:hypothetical protein
MCKTHNVETTGAKPVLAARVKAAVLKARAREWRQMKKNLPPSSSSNNKTCGARSISSVKKKNSWMTAAGQFANAVLDDVPLAWAEERVLLEPVLWPAMLIDTPVTETEVRDAWNFDGPFIRSFRGAVRLALPHATEEDVDDLVEGLLDVRTMLKTCNDPTEFFSANRRKMRKLMKTARVLQITDMRMKGHATVASKVEKRTAVDVTVYGATLAKAVSKSVGSNRKKSRESDEDSADDESEDAETRSRKKRRLRRGHRQITECDYCHAPVTGKSTRDFFTKHNPICPAAPKKK